MGTFPGKLDEAVAAHLAGRGTALKARSTALSRAYGRGATSASVDIAAYLAARLPATFAACSAALSTLAPYVEPQSLLDVGAGPGTASWAAVAQWPALAHITQVEPDPAFAALAAALNAASDNNALRSVQHLAVPLQHLVDDTSADVVIASYVLAELPIRDVASTASSLWPRAQQALVLIEPGTPQGFARIRAARETLIAAGAFLAAPCTHASNCPMTGGNWCHFKTRLARRRLHMHAKAATVPFEDEAYCYMVAVRHQVAVSGHRILERPAANKAGVTLKLCGPEGLATRHVPSRDKEAFRRARKLQWGDSL
jgi:ribosomal protein RSM22 (predicted rRNA methylase)